MRYGYHLLGVVKQNKLLLYSTISYQAGLSFGLTVGYKINLLYRFLQLSEISVVLVIYA